VTIDGEAVVLNNLLLPELHEDLAENQVTVVKVVPSGTSKHSACYAASVFKDKNTGMRFLESHPHVNYRNEHLEIQKSAFKKLINARPALEGKLTSAWILKNVSACLKLIWITRNGGYVTPGKTGKGFYIDGQLIPPGEKAVRTVLRYEDSKRNFHHIITKLMTATISAVDLDLISMNMLQS